MRSIPGVDSDAPVTSGRFQAYLSDLAHQEYVVAWGMAQRYLHQNESVVANLQ
jgi:hypothetical protein